VLDETYQYLVIYAHVPGTYFDYNTSCSTRPAPPGRWCWPVRTERRMAVGADRHRRRLGADGRCAVTPHVTATDTFPYWRPAPTRALTGFDYHVMNVSEGVLVPGAALAVVALATPPARRWAVHW
jgi:hypothetical protein